MAIKDWSTTATGNASAATINWAEGQAPSTVNNSAREMMAQIRQEYTPERWGWVAHSASVSVASQTVIKTAGDLTTDAVAGRTIKLTGGSTTVYADIVSSSYTSETAITLQNATGSLSASHDIVWLSAVYNTNLPKTITSKTLSAPTISSAVFSGTHSGTFTTTVGITIDSSGEALLTLDKGASGQTSYLAGQTGGSTRWLLALGNAAAESGSDAGSDFVVSRYSDAAAFIDNPLTITRSTGDVSIANDLTTSGNIFVNGAGDARLTVDAGAASNTADVVFKHAGLESWQTGSLGTSKSYFLARFISAVYQDIPFLIENSTGNVTIANDLSVTGALSKGSGSFKIDHPLKPDTHHLVHSFIEGPQADLIYRGKVRLINGVATVNLDEAGRMTEGTFVALNTNVQCFTSNEEGWTPLRGKVNGNILTIEAQDPTCTDEVSWLVVGERHDQHMLETDWTDENGRVITEPQKDATNPLGYGTELL